MSAVPKLHIVHESETQRQHVRLPLPVKLEINSRIYSATNLSSGGAAVAGMEGVFTRGRRIPVSIKLPFDAFSFDMNLEAEVQHYSAKTKILGCRFLNLTKAQIALLNHVLKAFMAGTVIGGGDLLNVVSRENFVKERGQADATLPGAANKKQIFGLLSAAVLGMAAAFFIGRNIYESLFIVKATDAVVRAPSIEMHAFAAGTYHPKLNGLLVEPGQVIAEIAPGDASRTGPYIPLQIKSPCECHVVEIFRNDGEYVSTGENLLALVPIDARPWVTAELGPFEAAKISMNTQAVITIAGGKKEFTGHVAGMKSGMNDPEAESWSGFTTRPVHIRIAPDQKIPTDLTGRPARVTFVAR